MTEILESLKRLSAMTVAHPVEHGCCLMLTGHPTIHDLCGEEDRIIPICEPDTHHQGVYKGFIHTHPPEEDGYQGVGFSDGDFHATLADGDRIAIVISGEQVYALARTHETRERGTMSLAEYFACQKLYADYLKRSENNQMSVAEAQLGFTIDMCKRLKFNTSE